MLRFASVGRRLTQPRVIALLAASLILLTPALSRADHIDDELVKNAEKMVKTLQEKGIKNVGVIKFLVTRGSDKLNANVGPINLNMATRVENSLVLGLDSTKPIGIIHDATQVAAAADPKMSISPKGRGSLFKPMYPLAWGKDKVTADAFITGTIELSPDMKKTTVDIGYFTSKESEKIQPLLSFTVATDRSILTDAGQSFALTKRSLSKKRSLDELDQEAANSAATGDNGKPVATQTDADNPLKFEIRYNDAPQAISADAASGGEMTVATPQKGQVVTFVMTNTSSERIGVVLKINGESALGQEIDEDAVCHKWVLAPGKEYTIKGFYSTTDNSVTIFKVLDDEESAARLAEWAGARPRAGYIDVAVFREAKENVPPEEEMAFSRGKLRGRSLPQQKANHPATAAAANKMMRELTTAKTAKSRGLIVGGDTKENVKLSEEQMTNTTQVANMQINYYKPPTP